MVMLTCMLMIQLFTLKTKDIVRVAAILNEDLINIHSWLCANKLSLHVGKTNSILICNHQRVRHLPTTNLDVKLGETNIEQVGNLKYLGVSIDAKLNFDQHFDDMTKKVNGGLGILKRCSSCIPFDTCKSLYYTLILPHMDYCSTVWSISSAKNIARIQRLQNRAMRVILKAGPRTHIEDMLSTLHWMSVRQRIHFNKMVLMWRVSHNLAPEYLVSKFKYVRDVHSYCTVASTRVTFGFHPATGLLSLLLVPGSGTLFHSKSGITIPLLVLKKRVLSIF